MDIDRAATRPVAPPVAALPAWLAWGLAVPLGWRFAAGLLAAVWLLFSLPWLVGGLTIPWDAKDYYYPMLRALGQAWQSGDSGFWNPYLLAGHPEIGDPQSWIFSIFWSLLAWLAPRLSQHMFDAFELLHLLAGGLGMLLLLRQHRLGAAAAAAGALVFMLGGAASARLQHTLMIASYAWLPWALLPLLIACEAEIWRRRLAAALCFALAASLMAVNRDQVAYLNCLLLIFVATWCVGRAFLSGPRAGFGVLATLAPAIPIGLAVLALPALLTFDLLSASNRPEIVYEVAGHGSLQPASLLGLLDPNFFGALDPGAYWGPGRRPWFALSMFGRDGTDETVSHLYIGVLPLLLLVAGLARGWLWRPAARPYAIGLAFALLYALGAYTPVFRLMFELLPGADLFRRPADAQFLVNAMAAVLVGFAFEAWLRAPPVRLVERGHVLVAALLLLATVGGVWVASRLGHTQDVARAIASEWIVAFLGLAALAAAARWLAPPAAALALLAVMAADLVHHNAATPFNAHAAGSVTAYTPQGAALAQRIAAAMPPGPMPWRAEIFGLGGSWQNAPSVYGLEQTLGYNPVRSARYEAAIGAGQNCHTMERRMTRQFDGYASDIARHLGIAVVVTGAPIESALPPAAIASLTLAERQGNAWIYKVAYPAPRWLLLEIDDLERLRGDAPDLSLGLEADSALGSIALVERTPSRLKLRVEAMRPSALLLHDRWHPAWQAYVDGRRVPVDRVALLFRGVELPAGAHDVTFVFEPLSRAALRASLKRVRVWLGLAS